MAHPATTLETQTPDPVIGGGSVHITPRAGGETPAAHYDDVYQRLGWTALVYAAVYLTVHLVETFSQVQEPLPGFSQVLSNLAATISILTSLGVFLLTRSRKLSPTTMIYVGLIYEVLGAVGIDMYFTWVSLDSRAILVGISWVTVWIMWFVLVVPTSPGKTLVGAMGAASMTPLMLAIGMARGVTNPSIPAIVHMSVPNYVCVVIAFISARIIYRMRQQVSAARAMGSYYLVELLGRGGMGEVWRAQHQRLARPAAIKLIRPSSLGGPGTNATTTLRRFEREAQVTATLESPNTVTLYDFGLSDDGSFYYVMELLRGLDLERLVTRFGPLRPERAVYLLRQACHSLQEAHDKGMIHRDIKPANLYACRLGANYDFVKVLDFGLVKTAAHTKQDLSVTLAGTTTGTPAFMAPELALGKTADGRADIYSLGCVGYWLLTGKLLFEASSPLEMVMHHVQTPPKSPSEFSEIRIPKDLEAVLLACLEKDPVRRPQSMAEVASRLASSTSDSWTSEDAREWYRINLPELSA
ncbi:MAG: serine/threonine-protein kinase [Candidatus Korobacteraceae bacterium]